MAISNRNEQKMSYPISDNRFTKEKMDQSKPAGRKAPRKGPEKKKGRVKDGGAMI